LTKVRTKYSLWAQGWARRKETNQRKTNKQIKGASRKDHRNFLNARFFLPFPSASTKHARGISLCWHYLEFHLKASMCWAFSINFHGNLDQEYVRNKMYSMWDYPLSSTSCKEKECSQCITIQHNIGILVDLKIQLSITTSNILGIPRKMSLVLSVLSKHDTERLFSFNYCFIRRCLTYFILSNVFESLSG
jgi:hypothetical protein